MLLALARTIVDAQNSSYVESIVKQISNRTESERAYLLNVTTQLREELFDGYDTLVPGEIPVVVELELVPIYANLETSERTMTVESWWRLTWYDLRLRWEPDAWEGIETIMVAGDEVWFPEVIPWHLVSEVEPRAEPHLQLSQDGMLYASIPRKDSYFCNFNLTRFPYDTQTCSFTIGPWLYPYSALQVIPNTKGVEFAYFEPNSEYLLRRVESRAASEIYSCCTAPFRTIIVQLVFERLPLQYRVAVTIPLIWTTYIGFLVYVLNPNAGERIGLAMTVMLTSVAIYLLIGDMMPTLGEWTQITRLYFVSCLANAYALFESGTVLLLAFLAAEAEQGRDAWRSPVLMHLINMLFWYWHVNIVLRWHFNEHFVRFRRQWRRANSKLKTQVDGAQKLTRQASKKLHIHAQGGLQAVRVAVSGFESAHHTNSGDVEASPESRDGHKAPVRSKSLKARALKAHWNEVRGSVIKHQKTRHAQQWLLKFGIPVRRIVELRYADRLWDEGFETLDSLELVTEEDLQNLGFLKGHVRQIVRIKQEALAAGSPVVTPVIAADFTVAGWLFDAGLPHTTISLYAKSLSDQGFDNRSALTGLTIDDLQELNFRRGHARILEAR